MNLIETSYNPDILNCIADLSNDEIFTSPKLVNSIIDNLPNKLWKDPDAKFLDPCSKTGVFLREIAKRLNDGLKDYIKNPQKRSDHIFSNQLFGISITELTSLMSRRTLYYSKNSKGTNSICKNFKNNDGNIYFKNYSHIWKNNICTACGSKMILYDRIGRESYAYPFLHDKDIYKDMKFFSASLKAYDDALKINKNSVDALYNMGVLFTEQNDHAHAVTYYEKVIQLNRNHKYSLDNLGNSYTELSRFDEAIASYNKAISIDPNFIQAQFNLGLLLLLTNSLKLGWEQYEYRLKKESYIKNKPFLNYKYWDGSNLDNKKLLIYCEQGIGDSVQFSRYIKNIKKNNTLIILLCSNTLKVLYKHFIEIDLIITSNKDAPEIDYYVSIMSLPYIFRNKKIPETYGFIKANKKLSINWQSKISSTTKMKIGLVWQGGINHASDYKRSIALNKFNPILCLKDFEFISLQKDFGREQIKSNKLKGFITDFFDDIKTFQETIALIENLDLVISVDTAIAHIAATMGKETWILLPFVPDFRWGLNQSTTSWYKTVKLFRQKKTNQWEQVIKEVKKKLLQKI